jgi:cytochrome c-type biogenesis protein CcmH/NrfG
MKATRKSPGRPCSRVMTRQRNSCQVKRDRYGLPAVLSWKQMLLCGLAITVSAIPLSAQLNSKYSPKFGMGHRPDATVIHSSTVDTNPTADEEGCFPWKLSAVRSTTVSVGRLKVPPKARREYEKACDASNKNKFEEAEQHARSAIDKFQNYSAGWVMLGVILEEQYKAQEARDACSHAATIDATYLPAYLCAAEVSVRNREWEQVLNSADLALGLKSGGDPYAYYYRAMAYMHMNNLAEARKSALQAVAIDVNHDDPSLYLLLAEIYEREGDKAEAIAQLQQFLKHPTDRQQEDAAKRFLTELESQQSTK